MMARVHRTARAKAASAEAGPPMSAKHGLPLAGARNLKMARSARACVRGSTVKPWGLVQD